jgi:hypothetical protein
MVGKAIAALKERGGSSTQAILKYIMANFNVGKDAKTVNVHLVAFFAGLAAGFFAAAGFLAFGFAAFFAAVFVGVLAFLGLAAFGFTAFFGLAAPKLKIEKNSNK